MQRRGLAWGTTLALLMVGCATPPTGLPPDRTVLAEHKDDEEEEAKPSAGKAEKEDEEAKPPAGKAEKEDEDEEEAEKPPATQPPPVTTGTGGGGVVVGPTVPLGVPPNLGRACQKLWLAASTTPDLRARHRVVGAMQLLGCGLGQVGPLLGGGGLPLLGRGHQPGRMGGHQQGRTGGHR